MKIGVYGSAGGSIGDEVKAKAREIGREIARRGYTLVTGACPGMPQEAVLGAYDLQGEVIGYSPGIDLNDHINRHGFPMRGFSKLIYVPADWPHAGDVAACRKYRNVSSVAAVDAGIIIGGRIGTMNEFTLLYGMGKDIGVLDGSGGITDGVLWALLEASDNESPSRIVRDSDPAALVAKIAELYI